MSQPAGVEISLAEFPRDREVIEGLFVAYAESLGIDLAFQNFEDELSQLPGKYATERGGALFLAFASTESTSTTTTESPTSSSQPKSDSHHSVSKVIGCVALRGFDAPNICELKRLYIDPGTRGLGAGQKLLETVMAKAKELGYREMLLDTLASMVAARRLYAKYGFEEVDKYYESPIKGTVFMKAML